MSTAELIVGRGRFLDAGFEALPIGALLCTPDGDRANGELRRIVGADRARSIGRRDLEPRLGLLEPPAKAASSSARRSPIRSALAGEPCAGQRMRLRRVDGGTAIVRVAAQPLSIGGAPGAIVTVADETAAHEAERLRDAFLGIVGHELRSPLSSILAAAELLRDEHLEAETRTEIATDLGEEAERLHRLVEQLIRLADLRRAGQPIGDEPTHLPHVVSGRIAKWHQRQPRLALMLELPDGTVPPVAGDEGYVSQVLDILIDNAVKYGGTSHPVVVRIERGQDEVLLHVLDNGPGLPGDAEPVFGLFVRAHPTGRSPRTAPPGQGIGLFVARSIVEALHGRIWARNRPGGGADIGFALPIVEA